MTQKKSLFCERNLIETTKNNYNTKKTDVSYIDNSWSLDVLDLKDHGPENTRGDRCILGSIDVFINFGWTVSLKNKVSQIIKDAFEKLTISSKRKSKLNKTERGKKINNSFFQNFLNNNNIKHYSGNSPLGAVFAECYNRTNGDLFEKPVFEKGDGNWVNILSTIMKQFNNRIQFFIKLMPIQASLKK